MPRTVRTFNAYHLGDNLVHLNFLRRAALANPGIQFVHAAQNQYQHQLREIVADIPNLKLTDYGYTEPGSSIDSWRGAKGFWYHHEDKHDFAKFHVEAWFPYLADRMGIVNPVKSVSDMLFDCPAIRYPKRLNPDLSKPFDVLVINSAPGSGQWRGFDEFAMANVATQMHLREKRVITTAKCPLVPCTMDYGLSVAAIGHLSLLCHTILMVSTGPSWTTFNVWNSTKMDPVRRIILIDSERVDLAPNTIHCSTVAEATSELQKAQLL